VQKIAIQKLLTSYLSFVFDIFPVASLKDRGAFFYLYILKVFPKTVGLYIFLFD